MLEMILEIIKTFLSDPTASTLFGILSIIIVIYVLRTFVKVIKAIMTMKDKLLKDENTEEMNIKMLNIISNTFQDVGKTMAEISENLRGLNRDVDSSKEAIHIIMNVFKDMLEEIKELRKDTNNNANNLAKVATILNQLVSDVKLIDKRVTELEIQRNNSN